MILQNHTIPVNENDWFTVIQVLLGYLSHCPRSWNICDRRYNRQCGFTDHRLRPGNFAVRNDLDSKAYQIAITISLLSFSSLGDIYGYRRIYLSGVLLFSITSGICTCADSFWMLTAARILQGFGAGRNH